MRFTQNKYLPYGVLALLSIPLFFLNIRDVHSWGDDFAQYIKEAQNIAHGKPFYQSGYIYNPYNTEYAPAQYPPGFPLLLAPVVGIWGIAIRPMLYMNTVIVVGLLFALFEYFRKQASVVAAICISIAITYSGVIIDLKGNILSDISCLLFVVLYLTFRNAKSFPWWRVLLLIFFAAMAILTRSQAILLLAAEGIYLFISVIKETFKDKRFSLEQLYRSPSLYIIAGGILVNSILNMTVFYSPIKTSIFYNQFIVQVIHGNLRAMAESNINFLLNNLSAFFSYETRNIFFKAGVSFGQSIAAVFSIIGIILSLKNRFVVDDIFFLLMCMLVLFLPIHDPRYFLPAMPLLFFYCYTTFRVILPAITKTNVRGVGILLTLIYLRMGYGYLKKTAEEVPKGCIPQPTDLAAFQYISQHVNDRDIIVFTKPRLLTLYTNKRSINTAWQISPEMNKKIFDSMQVKYMLIVDGLDDGYFKDYLRNTQHPIDSVRFGGYYTLYSLR